MSDTSQPVFPFKLNLEAPAFTLNLNSPEFVPGGSGATAQAAPVFTPAKTDTASLTTNTTVKSNSSNI